MKKIDLPLYFGGVLLCGCTLFGISDLQLLGQDDIHAIEHDASITVQVDDEAYKKALLDCWNKAYPKDKNVLHIYVDRQKSRQKYDVYWRNDHDIQKLRRHLYKITDVNEQSELHVPDALNIDKDYFVPMEGKGMVFMYNEETLHKRNGNIDDVESFEKIKMLGSYGYYHNRHPQYVEPFLFYDDDYNNNVERYQKMNEDINLLDDEFMENTFYDSKYIGGLIMNDGSYMKHDAYQQGKLHVRDIPTYKGVHFSAGLDTYGFCVDDDIKYPNAVHAFLKMARSRKGIEALIQNTIKTPLMDRSECDEIAVFDHTRKEIIQAMSQNHLYQKQFQRALIKHDFYNALEKSLYNKKAVTLSDLNEMIKKAT